MAIGLGIMTAAMSSCSRAQSGQPADSGPAGGAIAAPSRSGFNLTAWNTVANAGPLLPNGEAEAVFVVGNTGSVPARLVAGKPSCACSRLIIDDGLLHPGEQSRVRMRIKNERRVGWFDSHVYVAAEGQRWAETFRARAFGLGSAFPGDVIIARLSGDIPSFKGEAWTSTPNERIDVAVRAPDNDDMRSAVFPSVAQVGAAARDGEFFRRDITLPLRLVASQEKLQTLPGRVRSQIVINVSGAGWKQEHLLHLELALHD